MSLRLGSTIISGTVADSASKSGNNTFTGTNTFSNTITGTTSGNLDTNASNATATGKETIVGWNTTDISLAQNGYVKLANGIIIQWGTASASSPINLTFPTAFSNTNYSVTAIQISGTDNTSDVYITNKTATGCTLTQRTTKSVGYSWIAIGY